MFEILLTLGIYFLSALLPQADIFPQSPTSTPTPKKQEVLPAATLHAGDFIVTRVVDGDTIVVSDATTSYTIRLIGVNTPETVDPRSEVECFGMEASNKMKELVEYKKVRLEQDPTQGNKDRYSRLLRYVYRDDGLFINKWLIEEGFAYEYTYNTPYRFQAEFKQSQRNAQSGNKGLWNEMICPRE